MLRLFAEAVRIARSQPVASLVTALIVGAVCGVILSTTGQTIQAEQEVLARIDHAGSRSIIIADTQGSAAIHPDAIGRIAGLSTVEWVVGFGPAHDGRNTAVGPGGHPAAIRTLYGHLPAIVRATPWEQNAGTALAGPTAQHTLGLEHPVGGLRTTDGGDIAVVGGFEAAEPLAFLNRSLIAAPDADRPDAVVRTIHVLAHQPEHVAPLAIAALSVLDPADPTSVGIETSAALAEIRGAVRGELGRFGRQLVTLVLGIGLVLVGLNIYGAVTTRRRDFGRRRALGATRSAIITLVATQTLIVAVVGALAGAAVGVRLIQRWTDSSPDIGFTLAIAILAVLAAIAASIPPAIVAAYRDPVRILRVP